MNTLGVPTHGLRPSPFCEETETELGIARRRIVVQIHLRQCKSRSFQHHPGTLDDLACFEESHLRPIDNDCAAEVSASVSPWSWRTLGDLDPRWLPVIDLRHLPCWERLAGRFQVDQPGCQSSSHSEISRQTPSWVHTAYQTGLLSTCRTVPDIPRMSFALRLYRLLTGDFPFSPTTVGWAVNRALPGALSFSRTRA
jgi:hypothetical protein